MKPNSEIVLSVLDLAGVREGDRDQTAMGVELDGRRCLSEWDTRYQVIIEPTIVVLLSFPPK